MSKWFWAKRPSTVLSAMPKGGLSGFELVGILEHKLADGFARKGSLRYFCPPPVRDARVAELVDARDSNSRSARSVGSIPTPGTEKPRIIRGFFW